MDQNILINYCRKII